MDPRSSHHSRFRRLSSSLAWYRPRLLSHDRYKHNLADRRLVQLVGQNYPRFMRISCLLLDAPEHDVRRQALWYMMRYGLRDDSEAEMWVLAAIKDSSLRENVLLALGTVGTAACVPLLREAAESGVRTALVPYARQVRSDEDQVRALTLAREWLLTHDHDVRHEALEAMRLLSTAEAEEDLLIEAHERYPCEYITLSLGGATAWVLPYLYRKQAEFGPGCAEYNELEYAIYRLLTRLFTGHDPFKAEHHF
jgi:hypothetical protein